MKRILKITLTLAFAVTYQSTAIAAVNYYRFPVPDIVEKQVSFWHKIFSHYKKNQSVIHDPDRPQVIVDVIDFSALAKKFNNGIPYTWHQKKRIENKYKERYKLATQRFRKMGRKAVRFGPMEKRILTVYSKNKRDLKSLYSEVIVLRIQKGLKDEFDLAAARSKKYLPYMEEIFRNHKIPVDLTRLAFVESMFNEKAKSKVGASGIWQFMPGTARQFMKVNRFIDERNSPLKATIAAAKFMSNNYRRLKSWPLAITAYNHGPTGMKRAVRKTGTNDLGQIIDRYRSRSFGFASKNFYAEFLAANLVYKKKYKSQTTNRNPMDIKKLKINVPVSINWLTQNTALKKETIKDLNLCLDAKLFTKYPNKLLPRGYEIIVPKKIATNVASKIENIATHTKVKRKRIRL